MGTLGEMKDRGETIILYCQGHVGVRWCNHSYTPRIDQLIQYFGVDYDLLANRARFLSRFVCERCGGREASLQVDRAPPTDGKTGGPGGAHDHGPALSMEEIARREAEREAERRRLGIKTHAEMNAEWRAKRKAAKLAERKGEYFIGPPNPWAHRKRGRWL